MTILSYYLFKISRICRDSFPFISGVVIYIFAPFFLIFLPRGILISLFSQRNNFWFHLFFCCFLFYCFLFCLICSSFSRLLMWKVRLWSQTFHFFLYKCLLICFSLSAILAELNKFWYLCSNSLSSKRFLIYLVNFSLIHVLFISLLFVFQILGNFTEIFQFLIPSLLPCGEGTAAEVLTLWVYLMPCVWG